MSTPAAGVSLRVGSEGTVVEHRRVDLTAVLSALAPDEAVAMVPQLLPVCAQAQYIAAARALEAARGDYEVRELSLERERELLREQGLAAAWRLLIDWPRCLGEEPDTGRLKALRAADNAGLAEALHALFAAPAEATSLADSLEQLRALPGAIGALLRAARELPSPEHLSLRLLQSETLWEFAYPLLRPSAPAGQLVFAQGEMDLVSVGPLAMRRHRLQVALSEEPRISPAERLLLAMLLDTLWLAEALVHDKPPVDATGAQRQPSPHTGVGYALTSRGPLYHCVAIDGEGRISHWRYLAPTDWHFARGGLVEGLAASVDDPRLLQVLVAAADPCAPWDIIEGDAKREPA